MKFFASPIARANRLEKNLFRKVKDNLAIRTFSHVTPIANLPGIQAEGLQTSYAGTTYGVSGLEDFSVFQMNSRGFVHLCKDNASAIFYFIPWLRPSSFYHRLFEKANVPAAKVTVVLPKIPSFTAREAELESQFVSTGFFSVDRATLGLIQERCLVKDFADAFPGRFKTKNIPADYVFVQPITSVLRKPGEIGVDGFVSSRLLETIIPDSVRENLSEADQLEYLRGAIHNTRETLYPLSY